jgi:M6 family metalloprotease-like protein/uncharacterized repeat protein (TIGR01451 family)
VRTTTRRILVALSAGLCAILVAGDLPARAATRLVRVGGYHFVKYPSQPACTGAGTPLGTFAGFSRLQCAFANFSVDGGGTSSDGVAPDLDPLPEIEVRFYDQTGKLVYTQDALDDGDAAGDQYSFEIDPTLWDDPAPGNIRFELSGASAGDVLRGQPSFQFQYNQLGTRTILEKASFAVGAGGLPAEDLVVRGVTWEKYTKGSFLASDPTDPAPNPDLVPADVTIVLTKKDGTTVTKTATADTEGFFEVTFTKAEIGDVSATASESFRRSIKVAATATYADPASGLWGSSVTDTEREAFAPFESTPDRAQVRTTFVSERGWVAPGEEYIHDVEYRNASAAPAASVTITDVLPPGAVFVSATPAPSSVAGSTLTWSIGTVAPGTQWPAGASAANRIVVKARSATTTEDARVLYKDLSNAATISQAGFTPLASTAHGPKVSTQETARYGDRPFPVVLAEYADLKHSPAATGWTFYNRISNPDNPASLFTHYQNMSFHQLFPQGEVASVLATDTTFGAGGPFKWSNPYLKGNTCSGVTTVPPDPTGAASVEFDPAAAAARIVDGWYQLPGQRQYYGQDGKGTALTGAVVGIGALQDIDSGCGPTGKLAYDAASIADPDLDYNEFDFDRNCVVDFFEVAFQGRGGNGDSQVHGYDNVWPHSGNLQDSYLDSKGQFGYVSNDQCRDRLERPLWFTDASRTEKTTADKGADLKVPVRIGPYNVNPENGTTSVFAHEYGHSLGLPDFYSTGSRSTFEYWELMATDAFQYMSVFSRQDLGWIIPKRVPASLTTAIKESKVDTHRIDAVDARGQPYTLSGPSVHNGDAYYVELPHRILIEHVPSGTHAWYSTAGNSFGCPGRKLDVDLRSLKLAPEGSTLKLTFQSWYEIEWDFDYGFVMISTDHGKTFHSLESDAGTTTPNTFNPNANACQQQLDNGITGTSSSTGFPSNLAQRQTGDYPAPEFVEDSFDVSECAGQDCILRFAYATDTGLAKRGWIVDDLKVADDAGKVFFADDVEQQRLGSYFPAGWLRFQAGPAPFDHGYYVELRDRVANDFDSAGQGERAPIDFVPGISLIYTNEAHGYGNAGTDDPPAQSPLDPRPAPGDSEPRLWDASFFPLFGLDTFQDGNWTDNYEDPENTDGSNWVFKFSCFTMKVSSMSNLGVEGSETASLTMATSPKNCIKVAAIPQGKPKPKPLPATGSRGWPIALGSIAAMAAISLRRWLLAATPS